MTKEEKKEETFEEKFGYDPRTLYLTEVAKDYFDNDIGKGKQNSPLAKKALEELAKDIGKYDPSLDAALKDPHVLQKTIESRLETYSKETKNDTVESILNYHEKTFEDYVGSNLENSKEVLKPFMKMKYSDIMQEVGYAQHVLEGAQKGLKKYSKKDIENAEKTMKKYGSVYTAISIVQYKDKDDFKRKIKEMSDKETFAETFKPKEKSKQKVAA